MAYPRPQSRKRPIDVPECAELAEEIHDLRVSGVQPVAVLSGPREWRTLRGQPDARRFIDWWPGDEQTFAKVPVIIFAGQGKPRVMATMRDLEEARLGA